MKLASNSSWQLPRINDFLAETVIPVRLAVFDGDFPLICSIWFYWDEDAGCLLGASHENSYLVKKLQANPRCGFEVAPETPPYRGVRGKATVSLEHGGADKVLDRLIGRYLDNSNDKLAKWLLSRVDEEYVLRIKPSWLTAWDYSSRMEKS